MSSGFLTENHREYLRGERELSGNTKWSTDSRIRDRIRAGIQDFDLLFNQLPADQRQQIFEKRPKSRNADAQVGVQNAIMHGTKYNFAFTYLGLRDRGYTSEEIGRVFEDAIRNAENQRDEEEMPEEGRFLNAEVSIDVDRENQVDEDELLRKFDNGEPLSSGQLSFLLSNGHIEPKELTAYAGGESDNL